MRLTEKLNDFWEFVRDNSHAELEIVDDDYEDCESIYTLQLVRIRHTKGHDMRVYYRIQEAKDSGHVWFASSGIFSIGLDLSSTTAQHDATDIYDDGFIPSTDFILGLFFHHFQHFPHLPTLKTIALKSLNSQNIL